MSVVGISFGNESSYVAVACRGGVETVDNDYSLRATPSFVAFGEKQRLLGVAAKNQAVTNLGNTLYGFKRFLGRKITDNVVNDEASKLSVPVVPIKEGGVGFQVIYRKETHVFTPEQITAMLFTKLKKTAEMALQRPVKDCVISVPSYFTDCQRDALRVAAVIAGLTPLQLLNDTTAAAINYGMYKMKELPVADEPPRKVIFVDCGHLALQVSAAEVNNGTIKMMASASDSNLGGCNFDEVLMKYFCQNFRETYNILPETNMRAFVRLLGEIQKLRKQMSANSTKLPLTIDCFMDEKDVISYMDRATFENMSSNLLQRIEICLQKCLADSKWDPKDIHSVELVGGTTRMPAIKQIIEKVFHKVPSTTLNQDEAIATGCALRCAMMSPAFITQKFLIKDENESEVSEKSINSESQVSAHDNASSSVQDSGTSNQPIIIDDERHSASLDDLNHFIQLENEMVADDKKETDRINAMNTLEEYIYDLREKLDSVLKPFIEETERSKLFDTMQEIEDWLYAEGCNESKTVYKQRLLNLMKSAEPIKELFKEDQERVVSIQKLNEALSIGIKINDPGDEFNKLADEDKLSVKNIVQNMNTWLKETMTKLSVSSKWIPAPVSAATIRIQTENFIKNIHSIMNKPKAVPKVAQESEFDASSGSTEKHTPDKMNGNLDDAFPSSQDSQDMHVDTQSSDVVDQLQTSEGLNMDLDNPETD